jgi:hypothetical protein
MKKLLAGMIIGIAAGAGLALLTSQGNGGGGAEGGMAGQIKALLDRARSAFEQGRARALAAGRRAAITGGESAGESSVAVQETAAEGTRAVAAPAQGLMDQLKARWREAVTEGRVASAEKEAEMRRKYLEYTKRI